MAQQQFFAIGLMSGTSADGIDAALLKTDGHAVVENHGAITVPYTATFTQKLLNAARTHVADAVLITELTTLHAGAVWQLLEALNISATKIDYIGFHGHTIEHNPAQKITRQIGDAALLATLTGIDVVHDFRIKDVLAGGQGAPLVPIYHQTLATKWTQPAAIVNIGGVANITYIARGALIAFDTGVGNALLNDWIKKHTPYFYDDNGNIARQGTPNEAILTQLLANNFFAKQPSKSLDRNAFGLELFENCSLEDGAATLVHFTARALVKAQEFLPHSPQQWIVVGGGRHNGYLMEVLQELLHAPVVRGEEVGLSGDSVEAEAFAYLAVRSVLGLPISFPATTGVPTPLSGGFLTRAF